MRLLKFTTLIAISLLTLVSCGNQSGGKLDSAKDFVAIEKEIKSEFGSDAYYTELTITYNQSIGSIIGTTVTEDPESMKMGQWSLVQDTWTKKSEVFLEVPEGSKAAEFMFQLDEKINLETLGGLVSTSIETLKAKKDLENPKLHMAFIKFPKNGDVPKTEYVVMLKPEHGGTTFTFSYTLDGTLINMDY